jgi:AcrR family transcriptional regulator
MTQKKGTRRPTPVRRRNAVSTRQAILASARLAFARVGYDGAGVREIAKGAGVTAMLVNRYFGSKEQLFAEVLADTMAAPSILTEAFTNSRTPAADIAAALVEKMKPGVTPLDGFLIMFHSASSARAAAIGREQIESHHHKLVAAALGGRLAAERAALILSVIAGFQVMRQMIGLSALAEAEPKALTRMLGQLFQQLIEGARV